MVYLVRQSRPGLLRRWYQMHVDCGPTAGSAVSRRPVDPVQEDGYDAVPGSEFSVSRTAHRSNQSDYYINDRKVPSKDVADKLKSKGIDLDNNRFLILQV